MSESLFSMTEEVKELYTMLDDDECDPEVVWDTLEGKFGEIEVKAKAYTVIYNRLDMEMKRAEEIENRYHAIKEARKNEIASLKNRLLMAMDNLNVKSLAAGDLTIKIKGNGGVLPVDVPDTSKVPKEYTKTVIEVKPDKDKIRDYLKDHPDCEWAKLQERGRHIEIK